MVTALMPFFAYSAQILRVKETTADLLKQYTEAPLVALEAAVLAMLMMTPFVADSSMIRMADWDSRNGPRMLLRSFQ